MSNALRNYVLAVILLASANSAHADVIDFVAGGAGLDPDRVNFVSGFLAYNPSTNSITHIRTLSYHGLEEGEVGRIDPSEPWSGTFDGDNIQLSAKGKLDRHYMCGFIGDLHVSGDLRAGDVTFTLQFPNDVPEGCTLSGHLAQGRTTQVVIIDSVPEPSSIVLIATAGLFVARLRRAARVSDRR